MFLSSSAVAANLQAAQCLPVPLTQSELHVQCISTGCVVYWPCPNADGTWGYYAAWGHLAEIASNASALLEASSTVFSSLATLNAALTAIASTTDNYSDLQPVLQNLIAHYQPPNPGAIN